MDFRKEVIKLLKNVVKDVEESEIEIPSNKEFGDYAFPCFKLIKEYKKNPNEIAKDIVGQIETNKSIKKIIAIGPYINFFINQEKLAEGIISEILKKKDKYGSLGIGKGKKIILEHTSINPNASPHVGRARNAFIGDSLKRILQFQGYKVDTHYFVNDVGKQIAMLVYAAGNRKLKFNELLSEYVIINERIKSNPNLEKEVFDLLYRLEKGDLKVKKKFKEIVDVCIKGQVKIFDNLDIKWNKFDYESKYLWNKGTDEILKLLKKTGKLFTDEDNRFVLNQEGHDLSMKSPVLVLTRNDGTSLYPLRDIAYNLDKIKLGKNILVLGEDQKLYFQQLKIVLELLKKESPEVVHYSFVCLKDKGSMSTRRGEVVLLEDFMKEAVNKAREEIKKRGGKNEKTANIIGNGAVKYSFLRVGNDKNVLFDWESALNFEGESAPYIQYAYARSKSILKKNKNKIGNFDFSLLSSNEEFRLVELLSKFEEICLKVCEELKPQLIANYVYELSKSFNEFYHACPVLDAEKKLKNVRLGLVLASGYVIKNGLNLIGIDVAERM